MTSGIKRLFLSHPLIFLSIFFLIIRLLFLTRLPIFNDEAIYIDWGWRETHNPGFLFYSLYDAKQPLIMWLFGISEELFSNTLFAGRVVSVLLGLIGVIGLYKLLYKTINSQYALLGSMIYSFIPIFLFYDRQALMESAMVAVAFWGCFYTLEVISRYRLSSSAMLGAVYGLGFFSKSTSLIFFGASLLIIVFSFVKEEKRSSVIRHVGLALSVFIGICLLLFIQPEFWSTLSSNSRYALSLNEVATQSVFYWIDKIISNIHITLLGITPFLAIVGIIGINKVLRNNDSLLKKVLFLFVLTFGVQFVFSRFATPRYLVSFLALFVPFIIYGYRCLSRKSRLVFLLLLILPVILSTIYIVSPIEYLNHIGFGVDEGYTRGQTSGIGIEEAGAYIRSVAGRKPIFIGMALNAGNPESGIRDFFQKDEFIKTGFMDSHDLGDLSSVDCLQSATPLYYLTRNEELGDFKKYFKKIKTVHQPGSSYTIGIYRLKDDCKGKSVTLKAIKT